MRALNVPSLETPGPRIWKPEAVLPVSLLCLTSSFEAFSRNSTGEAGAEVSGRMGRGPLSPAVSLPWLAPHPRRSRAVGRTLRHGSGRAADTSQRRRTSQAAGILAAENLPSLWSWAETASGAPGRLPQQKWVQDNDDMAKMLLQARRAQHAQPDFMLQLLSIWRCTTRRQVGRPPSCRFWPRTGLKASRSSRPALVEKAVAVSPRVPHFPTVADIWARCDELRRGETALVTRKLGLPPGRTLTREEQRMP